MTRKEAVREYKERKTPRGIFAIRCSEGERVWIGASPNLDAAKNGYWAGLKMGANHERALQAEWNAHGESAFSYEVLEVLDDDVHPTGLRDLLKAKQAEWVTKLGGVKLL